MIQIEANLSCQWLQDNRMSVTGEKSKFLIMGTSECRCSKLNNNTKNSIQVDGKTVEESISEKVLGIIMNNNLSWSGYLNGETWKESDNYQGLFSILSQRVGLIRKLSFHCNRRNLMILANGLFYSKLQYCMPLFISTWNLDLYKDGNSRIINFSKDDCQKLQVLQNQICRILLGKRNLYYKQSISTEQLLRRCNQLSIHQLGAYTTVVLVKKTLLKQEPRYFQEHLLYKQENRLRSREVLEPINANLNVSRSSFFYRGIKLYNLLPRYIQNEQKIEKFEEELRKWTKLNISIKP